MHGTVSFPHMWAGPCSERPRQQSPKAVLCLRKTGALVHPPVGPGPAAARAINGGY